MLKASIITPFPDGIQFERQSRWSVKLKVLPAQCSLEGLGVISSISASSDGVSTRGYALASRHALSQDALRDALAKVKQKAMGDMKQRIGSPAPQKRKVSRSQNLDGTKRRRHDLCDENRDKLFIDTHFVDDASYQSEQRSPEEANDPGISCGSPNAKRPSVGQHTRHLFCAPPLSNYGQKGQHDSGYSSANISPMDASVEQQRIVCNYHEFADRKLFKDIGLLVSPVSEGESQAYERIFMGNSELFSPVSNDSAMNIDAVRGDV